MVSVIRKFARLLEPGQKKKVVILFFMMLMGAFLEVVGVSMMLPLMSAIMQPDIIETNDFIRQICGVLGIHSHRSFVVLCIIVLILVFIAKDLFLIFQYYVQGRFICNNRFATQHRLLHSFIMKPYEYHLHVQSGEIVRIIQRDAEETYTLLTTLLGFATESVVSFALIVTVFIIEPVMTIFIAIALGINMLIIAKIVKPILRREGLSLQRNKMLTNKWLLQAINGIKEMKVAHKEAFFEENYNKNGRCAIEAERWYFVLGNVPRLLIEMVSICSVLLVLLIMIIMGKDINSLIPALGAFAMAAVKLLPSANRIVAALNDIAFREPALDKTLENLVGMEKMESESGVPYVKGKKSFALKSEIVLKNIFYSYPGSDQSVLQNADMVIPIGKSVGIVGASGAGKTTVVDIMLGLLVPQKGQVLVDGRDIQENIADWLSHVGYIPQMIFMMDDTIRVNVAFGIPEEEIEEKALWKALEEAQLADFVKGLPEGLNTVIGERGIRLSGGQRQRIGIARSLYSNPEILFFDEATSALDNETEAAIMESINSLHGKKTMIIIAHRLQTIEGCDMVYRVEDGKIKRDR